jgi:hypothetical protein
MTRCIPGSSAPRLLVPHWIDESGQPRPPPTLTELGSRHRILLFYQHSCPGCHLHGFPTLLALIARMASNDVGFAVVQTVFERVDVNTSDQLIDDQNRYGLRIPFGHDTIASDGRYPNNDGELPYGRYAVVCRHRSCGNGNRE